MLPWNYRLNPAQPLNKNEIPWWPPCFTTFWPLKVGTLHERKISLKKLSKCKVHFLNHTSKIINKRSEILFKKSATNIYPSNKYDFFPIILLLTNYKALCNLNILLGLLMSNYEVVIFPLVSWVRCGAFFRFLIFALFLTYIIYF